MTILTDRREAAPGAQPFFDLSRLIDPMDLDTFRREYWERQPLHVPRNDPDYFTDLLTLADVDRLLMLAGPGYDNIRVVVEGKETKVSELRQYGRNGHANTLEALYARYRAGATIVLNSLEQRWEPLDRFTSQLGATMNARLQTNIYLTPGGEARGFNPHYDTHDVIILQAHGTKRWRLYDSPYELPMETQPYDHGRIPPEATQEIELTAGSLLYLPRGTVHAATTADTASVHITVGIHPVLWPTVLQDALRKLIDEDVRFRTGLPMGFADDEALQRQTEEKLTELIAVMAAKLSPQEMTTDAVQRAVSIGRPALSGHLVDLEEVSRIGLGTPVRRRTGLRWRLTRVGESVELDFHNKTVRLPADVADEVRHIAEFGEAGFTAGGLVSELDDPGRLVLVRTLAQEGFLTLG